MIDLSKPLGIHNDIIFYGDHEHSDLVYYFPDQVSLAKQMGGGGDETGLYELFFQIFHEGDISEGGIEDLRKSAGSILQLGVQCKVDEKRLEKALESLKGVHVLPENLRVSTPLWKDGSVQLIALDATTTNLETMGEDAFVKSIVGSHKPSLMSTDLKSIFNIRFDRRGTALINSALEGGTGSVAGVLYDLKYTAIRPAVDLKIWADLGRCYDSVSHSVGVEIQYSKFSIGADFEWLTKKLVENGDIKIELLTQVEDAETKKMIDEMVKEFKESILKELFRPYVDPAVPSIAGAAGMDAGFGIGVSYKFKKEKIDHGKIIEVDYRERSTTVRTHNPQSHLWLFGRQIEENKSKYIQKVVFSDLWREQELEIQLMHDFKADDNDLLSAEVIIWRKKDGLANDVNEGRFSIPANADSLKNITFHANAVEPVKMAWLYDENEEVGYYYQIRFLYSGKINNISSPKEIVTGPIYSSNQDLIIFPDTYTYYKQLELRQGNISFDEISGVDIALQLKNKDGELLDVEVVTLNEVTKKEIWTVRGRDKNNLFIEATREFHFKDDRPSIKTEPVYLVDDEVIVNRPLKKSAFELIPVIAGKNEHIKEIILKIILESPSLEEPVTELYRIPGPGFSIDPIGIKLNSNDDIIKYVAQAITDEGKIVDIADGQVTDNALVIDLKKADQDQVVFVWDGPNPEAADLKYLRVELRSLDAAGNVTDLQGIEYKGDELPEPITKVFDRSLKIEMKIIKRFFDGTKEKGEFETITGEEVTIKVR